eukprot:1457708-Amphidinium_carterae.1
MPSMTSKARRDVQELFDLFLAQKTVPEMMLLVMMLLRTTHRSVARTKPPTKYLESLSTSLGYLHPANHNVMGLAYFERTHNCRLAAVARHALAHRKKHFTSAVMRVTTTSARSMGPKRWHE